MSTDELMKKACKFVVQDTGYDEFRHSCGNGWYSHGVLGKALEMTSPPVWRMMDRPARANDVCLLARDDVAGIIVNLRNAHWTCIVHSGGSHFYVDSLSYPKIIQEKEFAELLSSHPMSFFVVKHDAEDFH